MHGWTEPFGVPQVCPLDGIDRSVGHVSDSFKNRGPLRANMGAMTPHISNYLDNAARFSAVVDAAADLSSASPCDGWAGADVLYHVIDTQRDFLAQRGCDLGRRPTGAPADSWHRHLDAVRRVVADESLVTTEYDGYFGRTTLAATLAEFYGFDLIAHRWDLGRATGQEVSFSDAEMDALETAIGGFGEALYMEGICARPVAVPDDATRQQRILATLGRRA